MRTTIDAAGRIVIPKPVRQRLGLSAGETLELREREGWLEIEPLATPMSLVRKKRGVVAVPRKPLPPLSDAVVRTTLEKTRR